MTVSIVITRNNGCQWDTWFTYHCNLLSVKYHTSLSPIENLPLTLLLYISQWAGKWPLTIFANKQLKQDFYLIV